MRKLLSIIFAMLATAAMAQAPAFPGAEGVARLTTNGGRGGKIIHVTTLQDGTGPGTLRYACRQSGKRIVVFDVSGVIELTSALKIENGGITILGQTAPGDGICLKNYTFNISAPNVIVRFIRCRMGDEKKTEDDAMNSYFKTGNEKSNIIIDHCSLSWCTDECGSFYGINNFTLQWCVLSESLRNSIHDKGAHGYGGIWGGHNAAYHHNLLAHHDSRNPRFDHDYVNTLKGPIDYINNVVYNWGSNSTYGGESANNDNNYRKINMINNYYKPGPATQKNVKNRLAYYWTSCSNCTNAMNVNTIVPAHIYADGNCMYDNSSVTTNNWNGIFIQSGSTSSINSPTRFTTSETNLITTHSAENAFDKVLAYAGASYKKDVIDQRIAEETKEGKYTFNGSNGSTNGLIDTQTDVMGWPEYISKDKLTDTDNDGMPDIWETANGLNPNNADDALTYTLDSKHYYTNIEVYANSLVEDLIKAQNADAQTSIDEYYPTTTKVVGIPYYDPNVPAEGGYLEAEGLPGTITWTLSSNTNAAYSDSYTNYMGSNSFVAGSNLSVSGYGTYGGVRFCKIQAKEKEDKAQESNRVVLSFNTATGYKFQATKIAFKACKIGTGNGNFDATWNDAGGAISLVKSASPSRNRQDTDGNNFFTPYNFDLNTTSTETDGTCSLTLNIYNIQYSQSGEIITYKEMGLADVIISGVITNIETGIAVPVTLSPALTTEYFTLGGQRVNGATKGIVIKRQRYADGTSKATKVIR